MLQGACVLGINEPPVTIKNIENAIIDYAWSHGFMQPDPPQDYTGKQIAVVGSGPAGLACAAQLNKVSMSVTEPRNRYVILVLFVFHLDARFDTNL